MIIRDESSTLGAAGRSAVVASHLVTITWVVSFALLTAVAAKVQVPLAPVPMTLQTAVVMLAGIMLGPLAGAASQALYLGMGLAGLPVFAGPLPGAAYLLGPTGGYLLAFVPAAAAAGWIAGPGSHTLRRLVLGATLGTAVVFTLGVSWLAVIFRLGGATAVAAGLAPFLLGAAAKIVMVVSVAKLVEAGRLGRR
jgi:biotin transport system substrate-specific component